MDTRDLTVRLRGDTSGLKRALQVAESGTDKLKRSFKNAQAGSALFLGGLTLATAGAVAFGVKSVKAYDDSVAASTKLRTNLMNVKGATFDQYIMLQNLASELQNVGVIEDDVIKAGMSQLATFNLQASSIANLTPKITDMVAQLKGHNATAEDMVAINNLVGKVMTGNVGSLSRYGVTLSENQKELLKNGNETERVAVLNEVLSQNYGKVNEALRNTPQGRITALKNSWGDFTEEIGGFVYEVIGPLIKGLDQWMQSMGGAEGMIESFQNFINEKVKPNLPIIAGIITAVLVPAFIALAGSIWSAVAPILPFIAAGALIGLLVKRLMERFGGFQGLMDQIKPTLDGIAKIFREAILPELQNMWAMLSEHLLPALKRLWNTLGPVLMPVLKFLAIFIGATLVIAFKLLMKWLGHVIHVWSLLIGWLSNAIQWIKNVYNAIKNNWGSIKPMLAAAFRGVTDTIFAPFKLAFNLIASAWNATVGKLSFTAPSWVPGIGGKGFDVPDVPMLAEGGIVSRPTLAMIGEGRESEAVIPLSKLDRMIAGGGNNSTINVNVDIGMYAGMANEKRQIAIEIWRELTREARSHGFKLPQIGIQLQ